MARLVQAKPTQCMVLIGNNPFVLKCMAEVLIYSRICLEIKPSTVLFHEQSSVYSVNCNIQLKITQFIAHFCRFIMKSCMICCRIIKLRDLSQLDKINRLVFMFKVSVNTF